MDMDNTMGEKRSIFVGRMMLCQNKSLGLRPESSLERRLGLPVSARSFFVFLSRSVTAYVSRMKMRQRIVKNPETMDRIQKTHRQPLA